MCGAFVVAARSDRKAALSQPITVWLKLDSGMHRVGLHPADYQAAYRRLLASGKVAKIVLMSHFARADELHDPSSTEQLAIFDKARQGLVAQISLRNSPAVLGWPQIPSDWVRPGIMLYGATPFDEPNAVASRLQPVMTLESKIISVRELPAGEPVGYGARFVTTQPTRVGVVAMGYADGYPRQAPTGTPVLVDGQRSQLVGRVSMDMLCVDLTDVPRPDSARPLSCGASTSSPATLPRPPTRFPIRFSATCGGCHASIPGLTPSASYRKSLHRTGFGSKCCKY